MSAADYGENWTEINDEQFINRVKQCLIGTEENRFEAYDFYTVPDTFDTSKSHYVIRIYAGKNGSGEWISYLSDLKTIFESLLNENKGNFGSAYLIEWRNNCASDTSAILIGLRDK